MQWLVCQLSIAAVTSVSLALCFRKKNGFQDYFFPASLKVISPYDTGIFHTFFFGIIVHASTTGLTLHLLHVQMMHFILQRAYHFHSLADLGLCEESLQSIYFCAINIITSSFNSVLIAYLSPINQHVSIGSVVV